MWGSSCGHVKFRSAYPCVIAIRHSIDFYQRTFVKKKNSGVKLEFLEFSSRFVSFHFSSLGSCFSFLLFSSSSFSVAFDSTSKDLPFEFSGCKSTEGARPCRRTEIVESIAPPFLIEAYY